MALAKTQHTYADYAAFCDQPANAGRLFELLDGEITEKIGGFEASEIAGEILYHLKHYLKQQPLGRVTAADGGYRMAATNVFIPDVGFITHARLPTTPEREAPVAPDLAVEVKSPTDRLPTLRQKAETYLAAGTQIVWLVLPQERKVEVYVAEADVLVLGLDDALAGGALLPGFRLPLADIFGRVTPR